VNAVTGILVSTAVGLVAGTVIGVIAVTVLGIHREERESSLTTGTTNRLALGARRLTGAYIRLPRLARDDAGRSGPDRSQGSR
jgi:hypothetical protein